MRAIPLVLLMLLLAAGGIWSAFDAAPVSLVPAGGTSSDDRAVAEPGGGALDLAPLPAEQGDGVGGTQRVVIARWSGRLLQVNLPLADAEVLCCSGASWQATVLARARTSAEGRFELPPQQQHCWLAVVHERAPIGWRSGMVSTKRELGDIDVPVPGSIVGRVHDAEGNAVVAARVACQISSNGFAVVDGQPVQAEAVTDHEGAFQLQRIQPGEHRLRCDSPDFAVATGIEVEVKVGAETTADITVHRGVVLNGIVLDWQGKPIEGAAIRAQDDRSTASDALGRFSFAHFRRGQDLRVTAAGHLERKVSHVDQVDRILDVQLDRAVKLRGAVNGTDGKSGTLRIEPVYSSRGSPSESMSYSLLYEELDVVRDGRFEVDGMACSAFELVVTVPGIGKVGPVRVEVDGDTEVEMTLVPVQQVELVLRGEDARPIEHAKLAVNPGAQKYPSLYQPGDGLVARILEGAKPTPIDAPGGLHTLMHFRGEALAFVLLVDGCLPVAQSFVAGAVPDRVELRMVRAGALRGVVTDRERAAYQSKFTFWPADMDDAIATGEAALTRGAREASQWPRSAAVRDDGSFTADRLPAGDYRGALVRSNRCHAEAGSKGLPIVDDGADQRVEVAFSVVAGRTTEVQITAAPLGVLRGRVLVRGVPTAGVAVMASRTGALDRGRQLYSPFDMDDWDDELNWQSVAGQLSDADGGFEVRYREAGPLELRVRHPEAHATSSPLIVELPPPGMVVVRDVTVPVGEIRGRFPIDELPPDARKDYRVTLFPLSKAGDDPFYSAGDFSSPIAWRCAHFEGEADGAFAFTYLPPGWWVVRVHSSVFGGRLLWQQVVELQGGRVDLGEIWPKRTPVQLSWQWAGGESARLEVHGLWLWRVLGEPPQQVWAGTLGGAAAKSEALEPGRYTVQPFGQPEYLGLGSLDGFGGPPIAAPVSITIAADGKVEPAVMTFVPLPKVEGK